jgi:thiamine pyrophosphate-dependent acetolactate synthase large subunit-like protein
VDVPGLARAAGYRSAATVQHAEGITGAIAEALAAPGPRLLDVHIAPGLARAGAVATELPRPSEPLRDLGAAFARRLRG